MEIKNKDLKKKIISISYKHKLSHIGSCITAVDIIDEIYRTKREDEKFILSAGHAHLAHLVVMEKYHQGQQDINIELLLGRYGIHCDRKAGCDVSTGSLGQGISIATGIAIANRNRNVYALLSDGEMNEGSCYESLEIAHEQKLSNLQIYINCNNWGAYKQLDRDHIINRCRAFTNVNINFRLTNTNELPFLRGQEAHYMTLTEENYKYAINKMAEE